MHDLCRDTSIRLTLLLAACTGYHTPAPTGVDTLVVAFRSQTKLPDEAVGVLTGPGPGGCYEFEASGGKTWWMFDLSPVAGVYTCSVGAYRSHPLFLTPRAGATSPTLFGEYRCGIRYVPIKPAELQPDGGWAILRTEAIPCSPAYPGPALPFDWPAGRGTVVP